MADTDYHLSRDAWQLIYRKLNNLTTFSFRLRDSVFITCLTACKRKGKHPKFA